MTAPILPHLRIVDFLDAQTHAALLEWALANEARFVPAQLAGGMVKPEARRALVLRDLGPIADLLDARLREAAPHWAAMLRSTPFAASEVELELGASHSHAVPIAENRRVDLLIVDIGAVTAFAVTDLPNPVLLAQDRVDPRAKRIGQRDRAFGITADVILVGRIEQKTRACPAADGHGQIHVHGKCAAGWEDEASRNR